MIYKSKFVLALVASMTLVAAACGANEATSEDNLSSEESSDIEQPSEAVGVALDTELFVDGALTEEPQLVECKLSNGEDSQCYTITVSGEPSDHGTGPFCPATTETDATDAGIWLDGESIWDIDGEFILGLSEIYADDTWKLYDDSGNVNITDSAEEFELAARPDVDESLYNHCVEGKFEYLEGGEPIAYTASIPANPTISQTPTTSAAVLGVTLNGIRIDNSAPVEAILSAYTIAAFDDCGGHFNPVEGYHMHAAMGCSTVALEGADAEMFAYAADGFPILTQIQETSDLDSCGGHDSSEIGYHYHASAPEDNSVIKCLSGLTTEDSAAGDRPLGPPPG